MSVLRWALLAILLTSCVHDGNGGDFCLNASPIYIDETDVLTDRTAEQILSLNEVGAKLCGWSPTS